MCAMHVSINTSRLRRLVVIAVCLSQCVSLCLTAHSRTSSIHTYSSSVREMVLLCVCVFLSKKEGKYNLQLWTPQLSQWPPVTLTLPHANHLLMIQAHFSLICCVHNPQNWCFRVFDVLAFTFMLYLHWCN